MASTTPHNLALLLLVLSLPPVAISFCLKENFPSGRAYVTCDDLHSFGAALHWNWTHDASSGSPSLSLAFVATPAAPGGWVAWGINPTGTGMAGGQALMALAGGANVSSTTASPPAVRTYNITGYAPLGEASTPIAFPATDLAVDVSSDGKVRLYATLKLEKGMTVVNHVWQVGSSVTRGAPDVHAMDPENLSAMGTLVLSDGAAPSPPAAARGSGGASSSGDGNGDWSPSPSPLGGSISRSADTARVSAPALVVLAFLGFLVG
ncbi:hypothetical protein HU200_033153 [Digitaria exilis]|uniref:DOMON domain-containing protein n=1 Tax=Digitaria exilis TaxID=1010633 RepID=A0A835BLJ2_9POAL|nr:hypothetical protein HU200_033153 [Digitaria exilis]